MAATEPLAQRFTSLQELRLPAAATMGLGDRAAPAPALPHWRAWLPLPPHIGRRPPRQPQLTAASFQLDAGGLRRALPVDAVAAALAMVQQPHLQRRRRRRRGPAFASLSTSVVSMLG